MKAQVASESLILLGFITFFIIPLLFYFLSFSSEKLSFIGDYQILSLINQICDTAAEVWYQGPGAKKSIIVFYPMGIKNIILGGDTVSQLSLFNTQQNELNKRKIIIESELFNKKKYFVDYCSSPIKNSKRFMSIAPDLSLNFKSSNDIYLPSGMRRLNFEYISEKINGEVHNGDYVLITRGGT
ncbi:MAG: hypothetical protein ACK4J0_00100 [Candidatus Anstonellaceae archaeon]